MKKMILMTMTSICLCGVLKSEPVVDIRLYIDSDQVSITKNECFIVGQKLLYSAPELCFDKRGMYVYLFNLNIIAENEHIDCTCEDCIMNDIDKWKLKDDEKTPSFSENGEDKKSE